MLTDPKRRLRVLLITARADHGGGPRHILDLLRSLDGRGIEFYIGSPDQEPYGPQFRSLTKKFFEIPPRSFSPFAFIRLLRVVRRSRIDVIHSHGRGAGLYSRLLGLLTGVRVLHTFHGIHRDPSLKGRVKLFVDRALSYFPFEPIYVSENEAREALAFGSVREGVVGYVIENAVDETRFKGRTRTPFSSQQLRIGAFVRDDIVKGPDLFLNLARDFGDAGQWTCVGITRVELSDYGQVPETLELVGLLKEPATWLMNLDVFVSCARNEGLPLGVLEAMAAGCLCILSHIPSHANFATSEAALLFSPEDPISFLSALSCLKNESELRATLLAKSHTMIESCHSLASFAGKLDRAYSR